MSGEEAGEIRQDYDKKHQTTKKQGDKTEKAIIKIIRNGKKKSSIINTIIIAEPRQSRAMLCSDVNA